MGVVAALGVPAGAQNSPPPDTPHAGDVASASCVAPAPHGFTDVPANSYYNVAVGWLVEAGITSGTVPGKYSPNSPVTRAQMALFLWHSADSPAPAGNHGFTDIPANSYYGDAVSWLVEAGITAGTSAGKYSPNRAVTRAQMAVFLWSAAGSPAPIGTHGFSDVVASSYYETAVTWLVEQQITSGTSPGKFFPFESGHPSTNGGVLVAFSLPNPSANPTHCRRGPPFVRAQTRRRYRVLLGIQHRRATRRRDQRQPVDANNSARAHRRHRHHSRAILFLCAQTGRHGFLLGKQLQRAVGRWQHHRPVDTNTSARAHRRHRHHRR
ncbi:MAG: S-layer homology domain-containing protein [Candidatus Microthrix sp.]|nr:S-layer homology domain-containing protein [Candidatus Microthrix sp.]